MMVCVLISLRVYINNVRAANDIRTSASHNRMLMTALNVAQKEIQAAGFGIAGADENDVATVFSPGSSSMPATRSILWRYFDDGVVQCRGLRETGVEIDGSTYRQLDLIESTADCNTTSSLTSLAWDGVSGNLGLWEIKGMLSPYIDTNETLFNFQLSQADCSVSRLAPASEHTIATVSAPNIAELNGHALPSNVINFCLVNIHPI